MYVKKICFHVARIFIAFIFLFTGFLKANDIIGTQIKFNEYFNAFGFSQLSFLSLTFAICLALIEFLIGFCLLVNLFVKRVSYALAILMAFFTLLTLYIAVTNSVSDCGCFGDFISLGNWQTFYKNILIDLFIIPLFYIKRFEQKTVKAKFYAVLIVAVGFIMFLRYSYVNLPMIDFRAYKIGSVIDLQDNQSSDSQVKLIYEKEGRQEVFGIDNLPDSSWTWIRTQENSKASKNQYDSFALVDEYSEDMTDFVLEEPKVYLIISEDLTKLSSDDVDKINSVVAELAELDQLFFIVVANSVEQVRKFNNKHQIESEFLYADKKLVQTMIRSNPGVIVLESSEVVAKMSKLNMKNEDLLMFIN